MLWCRGLHSELEVLEAMDLSHSLGYGVSMVHAEHHKPVVMLRSIEFQLSILSFQLYAERIGKSSHFRSPPHRDLRYHTTVVITDFLGCVARAVCALPFSYKSEW